jgi:hypothetical protein
MTMRQPKQRFIRTLLLALLGIFLPVNMLLLGKVAPIFGGIIILLIGLLGILLLLEIYVRTPYRQRDYFIIHEAQPEPPEELPQEREAICQAALRRVTQNKVTHPFDLLDIGLLVEHQEGSPARLIRHQAIDQTSYSLRPYAEVGALPAGEYQMGLELLSDNYTLVFSQVLATRFAPGQPLTLSPSQFFRLADWTQEKARTWWVRVRVNGHLLASHPFEWSPLQAQMLTQTSQDGELSNQMSRLAEDSQLTSLSLDDLLAEQAQGEEHE